LGKWEVGIPIEPWTAWDSALKEERREKGEGWWPFEKVNEDKVQGI
jgi:hypothetical protein